LGRALGRVRELRELLHAARTNPEQLGLLAQEVIARSLLARICEPDHAFLDVGAHVGSVIADVRHHQPGLTVNAIEADPEKAEGLARRFPSVDVHQCAAGDHEGVVTFFIDKLRPGYSSLAEAGRDRQDLKEVSVPMHRVDDLVSAATDVGVIKLDVEGSELAVLRGADYLVSRCRPVVQFESGPDSGAVLGLCAEDLFKYFAAREYQVLVPNRVAHDGPALELQGFLEAHHYPRRTLNYYAVPAERRVDVRDRARRILRIEPSS